MNSRNDNNITPQEAQTPEVPETNLSPEKELADSEKDKKVYDESLFENSTVFSKPVEQKKHHKLKPFSKGIIISCVALLVAGAVITVALIVPDSKKANTSSLSVSDAKTYTVLNKNENDYESITVHNNANPNGYTIVKGKRIEVDESVSAESSDTSSQPTEYSWSVKGCESFDMTGADYLVANVMKMSAIKQITPNSDDKTADDYSDTQSFEYAEATGSEPASSESSKTALVSSADTGGEIIESDNSDNSNADKYGFNNPFCVIKVRGVDSANDFTIIVGKQSPDLSGRYVSVSENDKVYLVDEQNMSYFSSNYPDMVNMSIVGTINQADNSSYYVDGTLTYIDSIKLGGTSRPNQIEIKTPDEESNILAFVVTSPVYRAGNEDTINNIVQVAKSGLYNSGAYVLNYTDADIEKYGLSNPYSTCEIKIGTYHVKLSFGEKQSDGYYPCVLSGTKAIFKVSSDSAPWIQYADKDLYYDSLFLEYIADVSGISVQTSSKTYDFNLVRKDSSKKSEFTVDCPQASDDVKIEKKQLCFYYSRLINLKSEETTTSGIPDSEPYLTFTISYTNASRTPDVIKLYKYSTRRYYYSLNGKGGALVSAKTVTDLHDCVSVLASGKEIGRYGS